MSWLTGPAIEGVVKLLRGFGILKDPEAEEKARASLREAQAQFLASTSGKLYEALRSLVIIGALWDVFGNQSRAWSAAAANLLALGWIGIVELLPIFWLFVGPEALMLLREIASAKATGRLVDLLKENVLKPASPAGGERVDEPEEPRTRPGREDR